MRQVLRQLQATLSVAMKIKSRAQQLRVLTDERQLFALEHVIRTLLAAALHQFRLVIEQLQVRRPADQVNVNDVLRSGYKVRLPRNQRIALPSDSRGGEQLVIEHRGQAKRTDPGAGVLKKLPAGLGQVVLMQRGHRLALGNRLV